MLLHFYFLKSIEDDGCEEAMRSIKLSDELLSTTLDGDEEKVTELIEQSHQDNTSILRYNDKIPLLVLSPLPTIPHKKTIQLNVSYKPEKTLQI